MALIIIVFCGLRSQHKETKISGTLNEVNVDWGHALPFSTKKYFQDFVQLNSSKFDSFEFVYAQEMRYQIFGCWIKLEVSEKRSFSSQMSKVELTDAFLSIFSKVTYSFESKQNTFPYSLLSDCSKSSFHQEDLIGNAISVYLSINKMNLKEFREKVSLKKTVIPNVELNHKTSEINMWNSGLSNITSDNSKFNDFLDVLENSSFLIQENSFVSEESSRLIVE